VKKKIILGIVIVVLSIVTAFLAMNKKEEVVNNKKPIVKIGISLPLTGNAGYAGQPAKIAAEMALKEWKNKNTKYNYKLIFEDTALDFKKTSMVGNKFMNIDKVNAMLSMWSISAKIFVEMNNISKKPIPHIACSWGTSITNGDYNFNNTTSIEKHTDLMIKKFKKENIKNVGLIFQNTSSDVEMQNVIVEKLKKNNINIVFNENFGFNEMDYRTFLTKQKNKNIDIIYFQLIPTDLQVFNKQMREIDINIPLTTVDYFVEVENKSPYEGYWFVTTKPYDDNEFVNNWDESVAPIKSCTLNIYDNLNILINSFENAKAEKNSIPTSKSMLEYMKNIKVWNGVMGKLEIKDNGHIDAEPKLAVIKNGEVEIIEE